MRYIDTRLRPPFARFKNAFYGTAPAAIASGEAFAASFGLKMAKTKYEPEMKICIEEMDEANIEIGFASPRRVRGASNDDLAALVTDYPGRFKAFANILTTDPTAVSLAEIDQYVVNGPCTGIYMEPAHIDNSEQMCINDKRIFPIYEKCEKESIPVLLGYGGLIGADFIWTKPETALEVVKTFPKLRVMLCHGGWPFVNEHCHIAYRNKNLFLDPDLYSFHAPGMADYFEAANYFLPDSVCFGTAYPLVDCVAAAKLYEERIVPKQFEKVMRGNALRFLGE